MIELVKLNYEYKKQLVEMLEEWIDYNNTHITDKSPYAIFKNDYHDFDNYLNKLEITNPSNGLVPDSVYFALDTERNIFVGAVNIRHYLNDKLLIDGGHIGDGVRPSERKKGYATEIIRLALIECKRLGLDKVLLVCSKGNIGSEKSIIKNGGVLENEITINGETNLRFWISI